MGLHVHGEASGPGTANVSFTHCWAPGTVVPTRVSRSHPVVLGWSERPSKGSRACRLASAPPPICFSPRTTVVVPWQMSTVPVSAASLRTALGTGWTTRSQPFDCGSRVGFGRSVPKE